MKGKLLFVVGLGVGYVLGTRAGRERYEQIARAADRVWNQPAVQQGVETVKDFASSKLGDVSDTVLDGVKQFIGNQTSKNRSSSQPTTSAAKTPSSSPASSSASTTRSKPSGAKSAGARPAGTKSAGAKSSARSGKPAASDS